VVECRALTKRYGERLAVDGVSFHVDAGECLGLLGPNGAGKTTTIRMLTGFALPSAGTVRVLGLPQVPATASVIKARLGVVSQEDSLDPDLSVEKNLLVYASYFGIRRAEASRRVDELIRFAELGDHRTDTIKQLSGGMRRRLMLARALLNEPELLVLDEPTTGLDPQARRLVWERIRRLKRGGTTILLTTHYMEEAQRLADRVAVIAHGHIVAEGTPDTIGGRADAAVRIRFVLPAGVAPEQLPMPAAMANGRVEVRTEDEVRVLHQLTGWALDAGVPLEQLTVERPSLEDVYLDLTGSGEDHEQ